MLTEGNGDSGEDDYLNMPYHGNIEISKREGREGRRRG